MPLIKITRNRQVTIPKELFDELRLSQEDYVEITRDGEQLVLKPKVVLDRAQFMAKREVQKILERTWRRNRSLDPKQVERVISEEVREARKARRQGGAAGL